MKLQISTITSFSLLTNSWGMLSCTFGLIIAHSDCLSYIFTLFTYLSTFIIRSQCLPVVGRICTKLFFFFTNPFRPTKFTSCISILVLIVSISSYPLLMILFSRATYIIYMLDKWPWSSYPEIMEFSRIDCISWKSRNHNGFSTNMRQTIIS